MNWREQITFGRERGYLPVEVRDMAWKFETCAVGEYHAQMPEVVVYVRQPGVRGGHQFPADATLCALGDEFPNALCQHRWDDAEFTLTAIEDRVLELKRAHAG